MAPFDAPKFKNKGSEQFLGLSISFPPPPRVGVIALWSQTHYQNICIFYNRNIPTHLTLHYRNETVLCRTDATEAIMQKLFPSLSTLDLLLWFHTRPVILINMYTAVYYNHVIASMHKNFNLLIISIYFITCKLPRVTM